MLRLVFPFLILLLSLSAIGCKKFVVFEGTSMRPIIDDGDVLMMEKELGELNRGDIVQFKYPKDPSKVFLKRVVGLPNENIEIHEGVTFINGKNILEDYVSPEMNTLKSSFPSKKVGNSEYFVMGDNRDNSSDSRYWGNVNKGLIVAKWSGEMNKRKR